MFKRRAPKTTLDASSSPRCVMCGAEVPVDVNGFCPLGHFVGAPQVSIASQVPVAAFPEPARRAEPEPGAVFTEPTVALPALDEAGPAAEPTVPLPVVSDPVGMYTGDLIDIPAEPEPLDSFAALFGAAAPEAEVTEDTFVPESFEPYAQADIEAEAQHALDELLAHGHIFAGDTDTQTEPAFSALDVPADALPAGADEPVDAYETGFESIAPPDDDIDDAVAARRRAAGLLGGSVLTLAMLAASVAVLPF